MYREATILLAALLGGKLPDIVYDGVINAERLVDGKLPFELGLAIHDNGNATFVDSGQAIGICGILQRDSLPRADLGFAFLPEYRRRGYALEAARAVLDHAATGLGITRLAAILTADNEASAGLLQKLGFRYAGPYRAGGNPTELDLYQIELEIP